MSEISLFATLAWGFGLAFLFGYIANRFRIPALVGYLLAGICIAPTTPGFIGDVNYASELSEIGITLLMFGVGLNFSIRDLLRVKSIAAPGALIQMTATTTLGCLFGVAAGFGFVASLILGLCLSCASTVVMVKALRAHGSLESGEGQVAVGWLVVEDMVSVLLLVLLPSLASFVHGTNPLNTAQIGSAIVETLCLIVGFIATMLIVGRRVLPWALMKAAKTGSREIFTLCVVSIAICIAFAASEVFKVSFALGAFFAGMMMRESEYAHRAVNDTLPLQDAFSVIFFLGVGMLFDPLILMNRPGEVLVVLLVILLGNGLLSALVVKMMGCTWRYALTIGAGLAQVGEFSFILAALAVELEFMPQELMTLILAGSIMSIAINPLLFHLINPLLAKIAPERPLPDPVVLNVGARLHHHHGQIVIVGCNVMGRRIYETLTDKGYTCIVIEQNVSRMTKLELERNFVLGDATQQATLERAHLETADLVIITIRDALTERKIIDEIREYNPVVKVIAFISHEGDRDFFKVQNDLLMPGVVCMDVRKELAKNLLHFSVDFMRARDR